ncbi:hypothetical protein [Hungatella hathewayi]|uniref:hypothetical protein n=1 Tax=Hungatella hathewayi TaxID=154046 RepID=UPI003566B255
MKKRDEEALHHYFRYGAKHRYTVGVLLEELIPGEKREHLIMYYMQIKDRIEKYGAQNFEEAVKQIKPKYIIISTNETINQYYKAVMEADSKIKEDLVLPSADEIRKMVELNGKNYIVRSGKTK